MGGLTTAMRTLTILPFPGKESKSYATSLYWFPIVGWLLGAILVGLGLVFDLSRVTTDLKSILLVIISVFITRAFHLDGLADMADGFGGGYTKEKVLAIMKDSSSGAFGVLALIIDILCKWIAFSALLELHALIWILIAYIGSRTLVVFQTVINPYARPEPGTAGLLVLEAKNRHLIVAFIIGIGSIIFLRGFWGCLVFVIAFLVTLIFGAYCRKRVGGVTGDLLGATSEIVEITMLFMAILVEMQFLSQSIPF